MKIPARYAPVLFGGLLSTIMVTLISGTLLVLHEGVHAGFFALWARSFLSTWPIAFPTALMVAPLVRRVVAGLTQAPLQMDAPRNSPC